MQFSQRIIGLLFLAVFAALGLTGCRGGSTQFEENPTAPRLRKIMQAYDIAVHKGRIPQNSDELKPFLLELSSRDNPEELLRSPNDGEPFEVAWGANPEQQEDLHALMAFEKKGVDGKRYVITVGRIVKPLTDEEFQGAKIAKGKKPRAPREGGAGKD